MSDEIPESLKLKLYKKYLESVGKKKDDSRSESPEETVLRSLADDRARELMEKLKAFYPSVYQALIGEFYRMLKEGVLREIDGLTVYSIIKTLGLDIKPDLKIKFVKHGKEVDFDEYVK